MTFQKRDVDHLSYKKSVSLTGIIPSLFHLPPLKWLSPPFPDTLPWKYPCKVTGVTCSFHGLYFDFVNCHMKVGLNIPTQVPMEIHLLNPKEMHTSKILVHGDMSVAIILCYTSVAQSMVVRMLTVHGNELKLSQIRIFILILLCFSTCSFIETM